MEGKKQSGSSFASDLFGPKDNPTNSSSSGIFASIFPPHNTGVGRESWNTSEYEKKNAYGNQSWSAKTGVSDKNGVGVEGQSQSSTNKNMNSYYQDQKIEPFHYSSSIYYGGQDVYTPPQTAQNPVFATFSKDGEDDDSGHASRGNWWQGRYICSGAAVYPSLCNRESDA